MKYIQVIERGIPEPPPVITATKSLTSNKLDALIDVVAIMMELVTLNVLDFLKRKIERFTCTPP